MNNHQVIHLPPRYYRYHGGFWKVTRCTGCGTTGLYEDQHPVRPCAICGAVVAEDGSARWCRRAPWWKFWRSDGRWVKPAPYYKGCAP